MARIALWLGGAHHPFDEIREWQKAFLESEGHEVVAPAIKELLGPNPPEADLWILGGLVYSGMGSDYEPLTHEQARRLEERITLNQPLLSLHSVIGSWDERQELDEVWDGRWVWDSSRHSPVEPFTVKVKERNHPLTEGLSSFTVTDELYYNLRPPQKSLVVLTAEYAETQWPLAWTFRRHVYFGLGHDLRSWENPGTQRFFSNSVRFLTANRA